MECLSDFPYLWSYALTASLSSGFRYERHPFGCLFFLSVGCASLAHGYAVSPLRGSVVAPSRRVDCIPCAVLRLPTVMLCRPCGALLLRLPGASFIYRVLRCAHGYAVSPLRSSVVAPSRCVVYIPWAALRPRLCCVAPAELCCCAFQVCRLYTVGCAAPTVMLCRPCGALLLRLPGASFIYRGLRFACPRLCCVAPAELCCCAFQARRLYSLFIIHYSLPLVSCHSDSLAITPRLPQSLLIANC